MYRYAYEFSRSLLFWIKGKILFDDSSIDLELTHCFFVFPIGKHRERIPMDNVSSVATDLTYNPQMALIALLAIAAGGMILFLGHWAGLLSLLFGTVMILAGVETKVSIHKSGTTITFGVPFFEREKIREMASKLEVCVRSHEVRRDVGTDRIVEAIRSSR